MSIAQLVHEILPSGSVAGGLATLSLAVAIGIAAGNIRVRGVRLGVAAVLFSALLFAQIGLTIDPAVREYLRDFSLVLFVYTLGLQLAPGLLASLKQEGLKLNLLAVAVLILGALLATTIVKLGFVPRNQAAGLFTGGFATTPALAAGQEALRQLAPVRHYDANRAVAATGLAYSVAYPFGLTGPILLILIYRALFRIDLPRELAELAASQEVRRPRLDVADVELANAALHQLRLRDEQFPRNPGVVFTRLLRGEMQFVPTGDTAVLIGDVIRLIGPKPAVEAMIDRLGRRSNVNLAEMSGALGRASLLVTHNHVLGRSLRELNLTNRHGVTLARVTRAGVDLPATATLKLQFGDNVTAIGPAAGLAAVEAEIGNNSDAVNTTQLIPIFFGIWLGVIVGSIPIALPGLNSSIRIGLAGGPLLVAVALARLGNIGSVVWYMPPAANQVLRDFGMAVFLACVGFESGDHFLQHLIGGGLPLVAWGACITMIPMFLVGLFARLVMKMNFVTLSGLIAGSMTSSPTLLFAAESTGSGAAALAYAAVYPLSMLVPVVAAQVLVTLLMR
jgi:putative transport protein